MNQPDRLHQAIALARAGRRAQARAMFREVVTDDPRNLAAWLWLSDLEESPEERLRALEKALALDPQNARVRERLEALRQERAREEQIARERTASLTRERLGQAQRALKARRRQQALDLLLHLVQDDERCEAAWLLLGELVPDIGDRVVALENALTLNPDNPKAEARLEKLRRLQHNPLVLGTWYEDRGDFQRALAAYLTASTLADAPAERDEADRRAELLQSRQEFPQVRVVSPTLSLLRLSLGLPLLYGLLILVQGGLNPLRVSPLLFAAGLGVLLGSLLIAVTTTRPRPPVWLALFWEPGGSGEPLARFTLGLAGWSLVAAAFALFFLSAVARLNAFAAAHP